MIVLGVRNGERRAGSRLKHLKKIQHYLNLVKSQR
jgi:hypothetical protein